MSLVWLQQGDQKIGEKIAQILEKIAKKVAKPKISKISTPKLNLKVHNNYIKPLWKPKNTCSKLLSWKCGAEIFDRRDSDWQPY